AWVATPSGENPHCRRPQGRRRLCLSRLPMCWGTAVRTSQKSERVAGQAPATHGSDTQREPRADHCRTQSAPPGVVWLLQTCAIHDISCRRWLCPSTPPGAPAEAGKTSGLWSYPERPSALAECFLCCSGAFHPSGSLWAGTPIPMRKLPTGEPCAGEPLARFGGRGGREPFPTPIKPPYQKLCREQRRGVVQL